MFEYSLHFPSFIPLHILVSIYHKFSNTIIPILQHQFLLNIQIPEHPNSLTIIPYSLS